MKWLDTTKGVHFIDHIIIQWREIVLMFILDYPESTSAADQSCLLGTIRADEQALYFLDFQNSLIRNSLLHLKLPAHSLVPDGPSRLLVSSYGVKSSYLLDFKFLLWVTWAQPAAIAWGELTMLAASSLVFVFVWIKPSQVKLFTRSQLLDVGNLTPASCDSLWRADNADCLQSGLQSSQPEC